MAPSDNLSERLRWVFLRQAFMAWLLLAVGLSLGSLLLRDALMQQRMLNEAENAWNLAGRTHYRSGSLPHSTGMGTYFVPTGGMPDHVPPALRSLPPGFHRMDGPWRLVYVGERAQGRLYMRIAPGMSDRIVYWTTILALGLSMIGIAMISWLGYRRSKRVVAPLSRLTEMVLAWDPRHSSAADFRIRVRADVNTYEVTHLGEALASMAERMEAYVERERDFTRDSSHELRTPLTVIGVASGLLAGELLSERGRRSLRRISTATRDMGEVLDAFLVLARHPDVPVDAEPVDVLDIAHEEAANAIDWLEGKPVEVRVHAVGVPGVHAPPRVVGTILSQFLRNACRFTESGRIDIEVGADSLQVRDSGIGMDAETMARAFDPFWRADISDYTVKGMGLTLARRLAERFGWSIGLQSEPGAGTTATLYFSDIPRVNR
ncbi:sensor histidine kinase [Lysobacter pythonis]|uniref:histidine kinase n=1 Tax=Solilutibacter pythonis TaxID=2483112 RepID=A0A3M2HUX3_9GAMM|nr:HAMP domain-containing sensor histidine kinase [Lysobacter pythonis]RMH93521.1 sensor histidine kinase [Lysobacter pythonis]